MLPSTHTTGLFSTTTYHDQTSNTGEITQGNAQHSSNTSSELTSQVVTNETTPQVAAETISAERNIVHMTTFLPQSRQQDESGTTNRIAAYALALVVVIIILALIVRSCRKHRHTASRNLPKYATDALPRASMSQVSNDSFSQDLPEHSFESRDRYISRDQYITESDALNYHQSTTDVHMPSTMKPSPTYNSNVVQAHSPASKSNNLNGATPRLPYVVHKYVFRARGAHSARPKSKQFDEQTLHQQILAKTEQADIVAISEQRELDKKFNTWSMVDLDEKIESCVAQHEEDLSRQRQIPAWIHESKFKRNNNRKEAIRQWATELLMHGEEFSFSVRDNGKFLVRAHDIPKGYYQLCLVYDCRVTIHTIRIGATPDLSTINQQYIGDFANIDDVIQLLSSEPLPSTWPQILTFGLDAVSMELVPASMAVPNLTP